jgi:hypothetical protein
MEDEETQMASPNIGIKRIWTCFPSVCSDWVFSSNTNNSSSQAVRRNKIWNPNQNVANILGGRNDSQHISYYWAKP